MSNNTELNNLIKELCVEFSLYLEDSTSANYRIFTDQACGITLFIEIEEHSKLSFYFLQRTYDVIYHGDRSDAHVVITLMFASFLRLIEPGISCSIFDIPHPVIEDEIWGRYMMPKQIPSFLGISSFKQLKDAVSRIIKAVVLWRDVFWQFASCPCEECLKGEKNDNLREYKLPDEILKSAESVFKSSSHVNYGNRSRPNWNYYYDMGNEVTIIKSAELSLYLNTVQTISNRKFEKVLGINGTLIIDGEINNFIDYKSNRKLDKLIKSLLQSEITTSYNLIPLENMIIAIASPYIVGLGRLCGINEYKIERELLRKRHNLESQLLFPVPLFEWQVDVCPEQFEGLIKSLLEREPNVKTVRRPAPINQGDKGRDLVIEWNILDSTNISESHPPASLIRIVGQCKASKSTIGKSKVLDIRDTVETHNAKGYFLAVSTQISAPLAEKLEELKTKGIWTSWWNREDIEIRLTKNQDLLPQYLKVLRAKHLIKFIDKE